MTFTLCLILASSELRIINCCGESRLFVHDVFTALGNVVTEALTRFSKCKQPSETQRTSLLGAALKTIQYVTPIHMARTVSTTILNS